MAGDFNAQIRVTLQDFGGFAQDRDRVRTQRGLVEVEVDTLQVDRHGNRATVRSDGLASLRTRALVVAVVDAVAVVIHVGAVRRDRRRGNRGNRLRAEGHGQADRSQQVGEGIFLRTDASLLIVEIEAGADFAEIAKANSTCPSSRQGGDLGSFGPGQMVKEFDTVVFSAPINVVQGPVKTQFGYHLLEVTSRQD